MGIDWFNEDGLGYPTTKIGKKRKPIILLCPGIGGGSKDYYAYSIAKAAFKQGFKCGIVIFRCGEDISITSARLTCSASTDDCTAAINFVYNKYVFDS